MTIECVHLRLSRTEGQIAHGHFSCRPLVFSVELCRESFAAEGASPAEVESEVALIKTQLAFVKQMKGDLDGALSDYRNVLKLKCVS